MSDLTVYYDGGCPLCSKEIAHYRRLDKPGRIRWVDLMAAGEELEQVGLDFETAMRRIHVREADGRLVSGVPAFVAMWRRLPGYRMLAGGVQGLRLTRPLEWGYVRFADRRYRRRCRDGASEIER